MILIAFDIYCILFSLVFVPLVFLSTGRVYQYSADLHAYLRLKSIAQLILENIPQLLFQVCIVFFFFVSLK